MENWTKLGNCIKGKCLAENADLAGGDLVKAMMAKFDPASIEKFDAAAIVTCCKDVCCKEAPCGCGLTADDAAAMLAEADKDGDGHIDAFEFETVLTTAGVL